MSAVLKRSLAGRSEAEILDLHDLWVGGDPPKARMRRIEALMAAMQDGSSADAVRRGLGENAAATLQVLLLADAPLTTSSVRRRLDPVAGSASGVRGALAELENVGLVGVARSSEHRERCWLVEPSLAQSLIEGATAVSLHPSELLTLRAFLVRYFRNSGAGEKAEDQAHRMYRLLASDAGLRERCGELSDDLQEVVWTILVERGGLLAVSDMADLGIDPSLRGRLRAALEEDSLGTIGDFNLEKFGIRQQGPVISIFGEAVVALLRDRSMEKLVEPDSVASIGVDFVSNFSRFAGFIGEESVRFTVNGSLFKSTGKRLAERLIRNPGREFKLREIFEIEYRFAMDSHLIDRTGEREFKLTEEGNAFLLLPLLDQQRRMLDWFVEDRELPGDLAHQLLLRRTALRFLKRMEQGRWYDPMFLPFVARNHYLAELVQERPDEQTQASFPLRSSADLRSLAWNLMHWVRKNLYLLGVVDLGYDSKGRLSAMRLTEMGAELLDVIPSRELQGSGHLVVNPDFEVVLFPEHRAFGLVYELDRFCDREKVDALFHYRMTPASLRRGLSQGMELDDILRLLTERSKTPLPKNVSFSLESWARSDGMVTWHAGGKLTCDCPEILDRLEYHPELKRLGLKRIDRCSAEVPGKVDPKNMRTWVRDFGVAFRTPS